LCSDGTLVDLYIRVRDWIDAPAGKRVFKAGGVCYKALASNPRVTTEPANVITVGTYHQTCNECLECYRWIQVSADIHCDTLTADNMTLIDRACDPIGTHSEAWVFNEAHTLATKWVRLTTFCPDVCGCNASLGVVSVCGDFTEDETGVDYPTTAEIEADCPAACVDCEDLAGNSYRITGPGGIDQVMTYLAGCAWQSAGYSLQFIYNFDTMASQWIVSEVFPGTAFAWGGFDPCDPTGTYGDWEVTLEP